jgi:hypothetical protein
VPSLTGSLTIVALSYSVRARRLRRSCWTVPGFLVILLTMTVHGRPLATLIAPEDLEALEETLAIMRDAATMNRLAESDAELARGEYVSAEELAEEVRGRQSQ